MARISTAFNLMLSGFQPLDQILNANIAESRFIIPRAALLVARHPNTSVYLLQPVQITRPLDGIVDASTAYTAVSAFLGGVKDSPITISDAINSVIIVASGSVVYSLPVPAAVVDQFRNRPWLVPGTTISADLEGDIYNVTKFVEAVEALPEDTRTAFDGAFMYYLNQELTLNSNEQPVIESLLDLKGKTKNPEYLKIVRLVNRVYEYIFVVSNALSVASIVGQDLLGFVQALNTFGTLNRERIRTLSAEEQTQPSAVMGALAQDNTFVTRFSSSVITTIPLSETHRQIISKGMQYDSNASPFASTLIALDSLGGQLTLANEKEKTRLPLEYVTFVDVDNGGVGAMTDFVQMAAPGHASLVTVPADKASAAKQELPLKKSDLLFENNKDVLIADNIVRVGAEFNAFDLSLSSTTTGAQALDYTDTLDPNSVYLTGIHHTDGSVKDVVSTVVVTDLPNAEESGGELKHLSFLDDVGDVITNMTVNSKTGDCKMGLKSPHPDVDGYRLSVSLLSK